LQDQLPSPIGRAAAQRGAWTLGVMSDEPRKRVTVEDLIRRHIQQHEKPYYDWLRLIVTLSLALLTALITLQNHYLSEKPNWPVLLGLGWLGLGATIVLGLASLATQFNIRLKAAQDLLNKLQSEGETAAVDFVRKRSSGVSAGIGHKLCANFMLWSFALALLAIFGFAILNIPHDA
jgi:hypothetical protein